jgi:spore coat polysaccharide biosynthesis protein SpsF
MVKRKTFIKLDPKKLKIISTVEARMRSTRLPGKVMKKILGKPVLELLIERLKKAKLIDDIVIATTVKKDDKVIEKLAKRLGVKCFRGPEKDILVRVLGAAKKFKAGIIVEITSDCPLIDPGIVDKCIKKFLSGKYDYVSTGCLKTTFPNGISVQVFPKTVLEKVNLLTNNPLDHEHVTLYIYNHPEKFKLGCVEAKGELNWPDLAITLDTPEDFKLIKTIFENLYPKNSQFTALDTVRFLKKRPELVKINKNPRRVYEYKHLLPRRSYQDEKQ